MGFSESGPRRESAIVDEITRRASTASEKIKQRVKEVFIPNLENLGASGSAWVNGLQNDFYHILKDRSDESGGGHYEGWTDEEVKELYSVLYGEELD